MVQRELAAGELVELQLQTYPHIGWLAGVDLLWHRRWLCKAKRWLRECLQRSKVFELDQCGMPAT